MKHELIGYQVQCFDLFPGIDLYYYSCDGAHIFEERYDDSNAVNALMINHCYRGGFEAVMRSGKNIYRGEGGTTLSYSPSVMTESRLPQEVYEGVSLCIIEQQFSGWIQRLLEHMNIDTRKIVQRYDLKTGWFCVPASEQLRELVQQLYKQMEQGDIGMLRITALGLINWVANLGEQVETFPLNPSLKVSRTVHRICRKMEEPEFFNMPLSSIIKEEDLNYSIFLRVFKELYNMTPLQYRKRHRLNHGAYLLKSTQLSVTEIATLCGYDNASKFSAAFKSQIGLNPLAYKRHESTIAE